MAANPTRTRVATALPLIAAFLLALYFAPAPLWIVLAAGVTGLAAWEWGKLAGVSTMGGVLFGALVVGLGIGLSLTAPATVWPHAAALAFWLMSPWLMARGIRLPGAPTHLAMGLLVLAPALLALIELRAATAHGLLALVGLVVIADSAAYFAGRRYGRRKLAPAISPGKTVEGVLGAWLAVSVYGVAVYLLTLSDHGIVALLMALAAAWMLLALSVVGDLWESVLKRQAGVKDSGNLLPGHGGVLDRVDSLTAVLPAATLLWMALQWMGWT